MRRTGAVVAGVALVLVAGCGGGSSSKAKGADALTVLAAAQSKTTAAKSAKVTMTVAANTGGQAVNINGDGAFDFAGKSGHLTMKIPNPQTGTPIEIETVYTGTTLYMHSAVFSALAGKEWLKVDLATFTGDASKLGAQDPTQGLAFLQGAKTVTVVGKEKVRGSSATHYRAVIDLDTAAAKLTGTASKLFERYRSLVGSTTLPIDVWVDGSGRVAREVVKVDAPASAATGGKAVSTTVTTEFYDWGAPVTLTLPKASEVGDGNALLKQFAGG